MVKALSYILIFFSYLLLTACTRDFEPVEPPKPMAGTATNNEEQTGTTANIDLSNWKVTLPIGNPTEVKPPAIKDYANIEVLKPYMFDDLTEGALVFYTEPGSTTTNSSYSRTELREQMVPGSNNTNWTFAQGGRMSGRLRVSDVSQFQNGDYHRTIVMQIHGRLTDQQRERIGASDNNAPPVLKIYWDEGRINVRRKVLKDLATSNDDKLRKDAWEDESVYFEKEVGFEPFSLTVLAQEGLLSVTLNEGEEEVVFDDIHVREWGVFENYFKAGNYLQTTTERAFATVKYFELEVAH